MQHTEEQTAVINAPIKRGEFCKVIAYAGTGKTSTLVGFAHRHREPALYLAFNKSVEQEAKSRFPVHVRPKTVHGLAWGTSGKNYPNLKYTVPYWAVQKHLKLDVYAATLVCKTLDNYLASADAKFDKKHAAEDTLRRYKSDISDDLAASADAIWQLMKKGAAPFEMTHNGYLKLYQLTKPEIKQRLLFLDEAQDTNPVTFDIVNRQRQFGTRIVMAGDPYQQIYSWRGAVDAMSFTEAQTFFLTQSFRFGKAVSGVANMILRAMHGETRELVGNGEDAIVQEFGKDERYTVITRTNVELFNQAVTVTAQKKNVHIVGEAGFSTLTDTVMDIYYLFTEQRDKIRDRNIAFHSDFFSLRQFAENRMDAELLSRIAIVDHYRKQIPKLVERIQSMTVPPVAAQVILVTAHKSKGLEWDNVALANDFDELYYSTSDPDDPELPRPIREKVLADTTFTEPDRRAALSRSITKDDVNLIYVAATRAKKKLILNKELIKLRYYSQAPKAA